MTSVLISTDDPRSLRAVEIAAGAAQWVHVADTTYAIESQREPGLHYLTGPDRCTCKDAQHGNAEACKHSLAVRLYLILSQAVVKPVKTPRLRVLTTVREA